MNTTAAPVALDVDEFELAGLHKEPASRVRSWRVAESPAVIECALERVVAVGDSFLVLGRVLVMAVDRAMLDGNRPQEWLLDPVARLSGSRYVTYGETVTLPRPR